MTAITAICTQSSVVVVTGEGGVGKSTVSATVSRLAARNGVSVSLVETVSRHRRLLLCPEGTHRLPLSRSGRSVSGDNVAGQVCGPGANATFWLR